MAKVIMTALVAGSVERSIREGRSWSRLENRMLDSEACTRQHQSALCSFRGGLAAKACGYRDRASRYAPDAIREAIFQTFPAEFCPREDFQAFAQARPAARLRLRQRRHGE